jgi:hypothetical protein
MSDRCLLCLDPPEDGHHVTATGDDGRYLDPKFTASVCHSCHELVGDDLNTIGTPRGATTDTFLGSLELRLTRTAAFVGRVAEAAPEPFATCLGWLAAHLERWASGLRTAIGALDQNAPTWRTIPGV